MKRITSLLLALTLAFSLCVPALAEDAAGTTLRLEETTGTVKVKDAAGADKTARAGMRLYNGYTVETGASSSGYISLDDTKAVKLDASGKVEIKKNGKKLEVSLTAGQLFFNVTEPLKADESLNIRTATMVTGIRGSFGWVNGTEIGLMHGHVTLTCINPETSAVRVTEVYSGEKVSYEAGASSAAADPELLEIDFVKEPVTLEDVPAIVVEQVASDETLQAQLAEYAAEAKAQNAAAEVIDVKELVDSLETKQAAEAAAETAAQAEAAAAAAAQETAIAAAATATESGSAAGTVYLSNTTEGTDSGYTGAEAATAGGGGGDSSSGGGGGSAPAPPTVVTVADAAQLNTILDTNEAVTFTGSGTATDLSIPSGKTLTVASDASLTLDGTSSNLSNTTFINRGTLTIAGEFNNGDASGTQPGTFRNYGTLTVAGGVINNNRGSSFYHEYGETGGYSVANKDGTEYFNVVFYDGDTQYDSLYTAAGKPFAQPANPTSADATRVFSHWARAADDTTAYDFANTPVTGNLALYAVWTEAGTFAISQLEALQDGANIKFIVSYSDAPTSFKYFQLAFMKDETTVETLTTAWDSDEPGTAYVGFFDARATLDNLITADKVTVTAMGSDGTVIGDPVTYQFRGTKTVIGVAASGLPDTATQTGTFTLAKKETETSADAIQSSATFRLSAAGSDGTGLYAFATYTSTDSASGALNFNYSFSTAPTNPIRFDGGYIATGSTAAAASDTLTLSFTAYDP